jgi:hypothetical protein
MSYKFTNEDRAKSQQNRDFKNMPNVFRKGTNHSHIYIKRLLTEYKGVKEECSECGISTWNNKPLKLQLDHIDGDNYNNES